MNKLLMSSKRFVKRNASTILTCAGGAGVIATSIMAVKATPKALYLLEVAREEKGEDLTKFESVQVAGPVYIPAILTGAATIACIFGANALNKRQQAALMSAYALLDNSYKEYNKKVIDLYGGQADEKIRGEISKDRYDRTDITVQDDQQLFYDEFSGRYFESTIANVIKAEYKLNKKLTMLDGAYLNEFYEFLGIPTTDYGDYLGWSASVMYDMYWNQWLDFHHQKVVMDDGLECTIIMFGKEPTPDFADY